MHVAGAAGQCMSSMVWHNDRLWRGRLVLPAVCSLVEPDALCRPPAAVLTFDYVTHPLVSAGSLLSCSFRGVGVGTCLGGGDEYRLRTGTVVLCCRLVMSLHHHMCTSQ